MAIGFSASASTTFPGSYSVHPDEPGRDGKEEKARRSQVSENFNEAYQAVENVVNRLDPNRDSISKETIFKTIVQVVLELAQLGKGDLHGKA